ncbi:MAG TPA: DnaA/Hda family protein [Hyphomonadaceae bacterium]|nr:DnaA/Hda family protein [Hyphomonadaceae bacterium]
MINKQNTTRYAAGAVGGAPQQAESSSPAHRNASSGAVASEPGANAIWAEVRDTLRRRLGDVKFDAWIAPLELIAEVNGEILLAAANEHERGRVDTNFGHYIQAAWGQADRAGRRTRIEARDKIAPEVLALAQPVAEEVEEEEVLEGLPSAETIVNADGDSEEVQTLDNFLVGDSNRLAYGLASRLALGGSVKAHVVTLVGPHGVGKTHLLRGIEAALKAQRGDDSVLYMSSEDFTVAFVEGVKRKDTSELRAMVRRAKVVLLDDFQFICSKPGTLIEFFSHLRAIVANGGVVVVACDQTPAVIDQLDDRMRDEIQGGVIVQMDLPERSLRREIVRAKAEAIAVAEADFVLQEDWVDLLADRLPASGRALSGAVRNVYVGTVMAGQPVSRAAVEKAIQLQLGGSPVKAPKIDTIKDVTAKAYGVTKQDLESSCRKRQYAQPRQYAMYLSRQLTKCSYPQIGRLFGDRDHTTVLFAYRKISAMVGANESMAEELRQLEQRILADPRNNR